MEYSQQRYAAYSRIARNGLRRLSGNATSTGDAAIMFETPTDNLADSEPYRGVLVIGDPHLEGRQPNFRCDDFPQVALSKLRWALEYADRQRLIPAVLGDLFHLPRDNPNWMIVELLQMIQQPVLAIYGNHDVRENSLTEHDTFSILVQSQRLRLLSPETPWTGIISGRRVVIGGCSWGTPLNEQLFESMAHWRREFGKDALILWLLHEDGPGDDPTEWKRRFQGFPANIVINGHIHRRREVATLGELTWITPGNITRRSRSDASRSHVPSVLAIRIEASGWQTEYVEVPHRPFDEVFHPQIATSPESASTSTFVAGLAELEARRTESGAGLIQFIESNLGSFSPPVANEVRRLAQEVLHS